MQVLELILAALEPLILMGVASLVAVAAPPVLRWFRDNSDNAFVALLGRVITAIVREVEQTDPGTAGAAKFVRAHNAAVKRLGAQRKRIEKVTGASLEEFVDTEVESAVLGLRQAKEAVANVGPTSTESRPRTRRARAK